MVLLLCSMEEKLRYLFEWIATLEGEKAQLARQVNNLEEELSKFYE